ncbi:hypothetical protein ROZALSC1DRAFT_25039 [Rozella allomycis CSF55]|uniref:Uncharacterized protein n=1 Tax=Rozella allomycis (strain CSF55) TaxID=988480 RepID=A0A4P9YEG4_ROZAC|nr:hypothetical protein ROZALSC1DRAFT_25039 [Rozella allomycis CSF55]
MRLQIFSHKEGHAATMLDFMRDLIAFSVVVYPTVPDRACSEFVQCSIHVITKHKTICTIIVFGNHESDNCKITYLIQILSLELETQKSLAEFHLYFCDRMRKGST